MLCSGVSAIITVACVFVKPFAAVGGTIVVLFIDWSGVIAGLSFFLYKAVCGGICYIFAKGATAGPSQPPRSGDGVASTERSFATVMLNLALFLSILGPGLGSALVVQAIPAMQINGMAKWAMVASVLAGVGVGTMLCCCGCRHRTAICAY